MPQLFDRTVTRVLFPSDIGQDPALTSVLRRGAKLLGEDVQCVHVVEGGHVAEGAEHSALIAADGTLTVGTLAEARGLDEMEASDAKTGLGKAHYNAISAAIAHTEVPTKFKRMAAEALAARFEELSGAFNKPMFLRAVLRGAAEEEEPEADAEESLDEAAPLMRKHFAMIAQAMAELDMPTNYKRAIVGAVAGAIGGDNPNFNHARFVKATGLSAGQVKEAHKAGHEEDEPEGDDAEDGEEDEPEGDDDEEDGEDDCEEGLETPADFDQECEMLVCYHPTGVQLVNEAGEIVALRRCNVEDPIASARAIDLVIEHAQALGYGPVEDAEDIDESVTPDSEEWLALECDAIDDLRTYLTIFVEACSIEELQRHGTVLSAIDTAINEGDYELAEELAEPLLEYKRMAQGARRARIRSMRLRRPKAVVSGSMNRSEHRRSLIKRRRKYRSSSGMRAKAKRYAKRYQRFRRRLRPIATAKSESFGRPQHREGTSEGETGLDVQEGAGRDAVRRAVSRGKPVDWDEIAPPRHALNRRLKGAPKRDAVTSTYNRYFEGKMVSVLDLPKLSNEIEKLLDSGRDIDADMKALVAKYVKESTDEAGDQLGVLAGEVMTWLINRPRTDAEQLTRQFRMTASAASAIMDIAAQVLAQGKTGGAGYNDYVAQIGAVLARDTAFESVGADRTFRGCLGEAADNDPNFKSKAKPYGLWYRTPKGVLVRMWRGKYNRVRWYTKDGKQVGPEQSNVAPAVAYALHNGWTDTDGEGGAIHVEEAALEEGFAVGDLLLKLFKDTRAQAKADSPMIREKLVELAARSMAALKAKHHEQEAEIVARVAREGGSWEDAKDALSI